MAKPWMVAISGATIWGNRGAEAMLATTVGMVRDRFPDTKFLVYSYSPKRDRALLRDPQVVVLPSRPIDLVLVHLPFSVLCWIFNRLKLRIPDGLLPRGVRLLRRCDVLIDLAGISFVDGRELFLPFNILTVWPAMVQGTPVVKLAQAMGPFNHPLNRRAARAVLTGCSHVYARGRITQAHLDSLGLAEGQASLAADVAFSYQERFSLSHENETLVRELEEKLGEIRSRGQRIIGLSPSSLVYEKADKIGFDYVQEFLKLIENLGQASEAHEFLLIPNATRQGRETTRNNDLYVINEINANAKKVLPDNLLERIHSVTFDVNTSAIRRFISVCDGLVTSRFHAMVAGLALGIPTLVVGWSHKYSEVLEAFGLEAWEVGFDEPGMDLLASTKRLLMERDTIQRQINAKRDRVLALSSAQFEDLERWLA